MIISYATKQDSRLVASNRRMESTSLIPCSCCPLGDNPHSNCYCSPFKLANSPIRCPHCLSKWHPPGRCLHASTARIHQSWSIIPRLETSQIPMWASTKSPSMVCSPPFRPSRMTPHSISVGSQSLFCSHQSWHHRSFNLCRWHSYHME